MKFYLTRAIVFLVILLGLDTLIFLTSFELGSFFTPEERTLLERHQKVEGVILGTSHAEQGIMPSILEDHTELDWYNFGRARRNLVFNLHYSKAMWKEGIRPKVVVLVATYHDWNERTHSYIIRDFLEQEQVTEVFLDFFKDRRFTDPRSWLLCDQYSSTHRMMLSRSLSWIKNKTRDLPFRPHPEDGFSGSPLMMKDEPRPETFERFPWKVRNLNRQAFIDTLDFWNSKKVPIVVVDPPEYLGSRLSHQEYERYEQETAQLCRERGVPYRSFSHPDHPIVNDPKMFRDGGWGYPNSHLNTRGAIEFSRELASWFKKVLMDVQTSAEDQSTISP